MTSQEITKPNTVYALKPPYSQCFFLSNSQQQPNCCSVQQHQPGLAIASLLPWTKSRNIGRVSAVTETEGFLVYGGAAEFIHGQTVTCTYIATRQLLC